MWHDPEVNFSDSVNLDAFARLRISQPETIFDSKQIFDNLPLFWDDQEVSGSGTTSTYSKPKARTELAVSLNTAGKRVRQTFMRFNYQPGKSQLIIMTGVLGQGTSGICQEIGYFDDDNGVFFRCEGGVRSVVIKNSATGSAVDEQVIQADWNLDKMDGLGRSKVLLDFSKTQIFFFDMEWLGVGRIRYGFFHNGMPIYCHEFLHSNNLEEVYMSTPNLPLRYSIENDGTGEVTILDQICSTVISEGGMTDLGVLRYSSTEETPIQANSVGTVYAINAIRLKGTHLAATIKIKNMSLMNDTNDNFEWVLLLNPTVATPVTFSAITNSAIEFAVGNGGGGASTSTLTGGTLITGGVIKSSGSTGDITLKIDNALRLGSTIDGTPDEIYLGVRPFSINANITGGMTWRELS